MERKSENETDKPPPVRGDYHDAERGKTAPPSPIRGDYHDGERD